jgi:hypothetical protein
MKKKYFLIVILISIIIGTFFLLQNKNTSEWKNNKIEYRLNQNSDIYLYHNKEKVTYYRVKEDSIVYCENISIDGVSKLCYLEISKDSEPLIGWINTEFLFEEKGGL